MFPPLLRAPTKNYLISPALLNGRFRSRKSTLFFTMTRFPCNFYTPLYDDYRLVASIAAFLWQKGKGLEKRKQWIAKGFKSGRENCFWWKVTLNVTKCEPFVSIKGSFLERIYYICCINSFIHFYPDSLMLIFQR